MSGNEPSGNEPCTVLMWMRDGSEREEVFASRFQAEIFLYLLPYFMSTMPDDAEHGVAAAMLSPLIPSNSTGLAVGEGLGRRDPGGHS